MDVRYSLKEDKRNHGEEELFTVLKRIPGLGESECEEDSIYKIAVIGCIFEWGNHVR